MRWAKRRAWLNAQGIDPQKAFEQQKKRTEQVAERVKTDETEDVAERVTKRRAITGWMETLVEVYRANLRE